MHRRGHRMQARNTADNALLLDMSRMNSVSIDVAAKTARVGTGAIFGNIARAAGAASGGTLVVCSGSDSSVGPYGWTVGGGYGRLTRTCVRCRRPDCFLICLATAQGMAADGSPIDRHRRTRRNRRQLLWHRSPCHDRQYSSIVVAVVVVRRT
jgi:FAD/FMN-containing dehydrogenase